MGRMPSGLTKILTPSAARESRDDDGSGSNEGGLDGDAGVSGSGIRKFGRSALRHGKTLGRSFVPIFHARALWETAADCRNAASGVSGPVLVAGRPKSAR